MNCRPFESPRYFNLGSARDLARILIRNVSPMYCHHEFLCFVHYYFLIESIVFNFIGAFLLWLGSLREGGGGGGDICIGMKIGDMENRPCLIPWQSKLSSFGNIFHGKTNSVPT